MQLAKSFPKYSEYYLKFAVKYSNKVKIWSTTGNDSNMNNVCKKISAVVELLKELKGKTKP